MRAGRLPFTLVSGVPVVTAPDEIDITNAAALRSVLLDAAAHGHGTLAVDMTATRFCDSSGLHTLLAAHKRAQGEGGELLLVCSAPAVLRVFELTAVDRIIPIFASLDQALARTLANGLAGRRSARGQRLTAAAGPSTSGLDGAAVP
jgi:anti-sigma B factor antagonist